MPAFADIERRIARGFRPALFLDFDGTLAPIAPRPSAAKLPERTRGILKALSRRIPLIVISGRELADVEARVDISGITYAGSHGFEWTFGGKTHTKRPGAAHRRALKKARTALLKLAPRFPGVIVEDKTFSFALNYRALHVHEAHRFVRAASAAVGAEQRLRILNELRTFEVMPRVAWNKGECALMLLRSFQRAQNANLFPVYIGDSETDEDAFKKLHAGVTIRIGNKARSAAHYSLKRSSIDTFLKKIKTLV